MEHCGAAELAGEAAGLRQFEDLLEDQLLATHRSIMLSRGRAIRANEEAACERLSHGSGTITALELQRADGSASRAMYVFQTGVDLLARLRALDPDAVEEARGSLELPGRREKVGTTPCTVSPLRPNRPQPAGSRGPRPVDQEASGGSGDAVDATLSQPVRDLSSEARSSNEAE
jgi:hypothetical protein